MLYRKLGILLRFLLRAFDIEIEERLYGIIESFFMTKEC